ncbi:bifunctional metallophosphatase/5'-nucleotidase [Shewanella algicola]|uniref:5'-nucleotidase C-terminal domain-containing protein n=1 Tax=Shewanella algicola TaxID=640633 RepID=A0A9X1Z3F6_9GAMM|nr:5'-nucleotidase C-terminal domain-containing protein [Shewanella algicola]MCL1104403.1 5'-nucleotidase C-terminal domain-containing protein [Shewanella algicola]GGP44029.1 bifunctional metallophosphatase/5'-nucleotidase [Shewanella algicola]
MNRTMYKGLLATAIIVALTGCNSSDDNNDTDVSTFNLRIAHINDTHSSFDPTSLDFTAQVNSEDMSIRTSVGGYPRVATALKNARTMATDANKPFLALHGGDAFQGSLYFNVLKGAGNATLLREMNLDAMTIGNHEFDLGDGPLIEFANKVNFPLLAANLDTSADSQMSGVTNIKSYTIKEYGDVKVGIFGLVLEDMKSISSPGDDLVFKGEVVTAQATVDALNEMGVDKVVMVSHIGLDRDIRIAESVNGVDVIVGGHSHTLLGDFTNIGNGMGSSIASYAEMITNPNGTSKTCIVQAGEVAQAVGQADITFENGEVTVCQGNNTLLIDNDFKHKYDGENRELLTEADQSAAEAFVGEQDNIAITEEDVLLRSIIDIDYKPLIEEFEGKVIGQVFDANDPIDTGMLDHVRQPGVKRNGASLPITGSEAGAHVAASMVWKLNQHGYGIDMAITNTGGVRNDIKNDATGNLTAGYIIGSLLYFSNELAIVELKGSDITQLLEDTINYSLTTSSGSFPTFANIEFTFNGKAVAGEQIEDLHVCPNGVAAGGCTDIDPEMTYKISTNAYIAGGKDGYEIFDTKKLSPVIKSGFIDNESMIEYVEALTLAGQKLEELPTGLTFIAPTSFEEKLDNPVFKPEDNQ